LVSSFLKENLPISLEKCIKRRYKANSQMNLKNNMNKIIEDVFLDTNDKLCNQQPFDTNFRFDYYLIISGSTCCTVMFNPDKLICANVGDSRAVLGRFINNEWKHYDLSKDHKPNDNEEMKRILSKGGRVEPYTDENGEYLGPSRVWLNHDDVPGLAMSRSFADQVAASVGVIAVPGSNI
jgi:serine/threonine protein phosphatase PrpC